MFELFSLSHIVVPAPALLLSLPRSKTYFDVKIKPTNLLKKSDWFNWIDQLMLPVRLGMGAGQLGIRRLRSVGGGQVHRLLLQPDGLCLLAQRRCRFWRNARGDLRPEPVPSAGRDNQGSISQSVTTIMLLAFFLLALSTLHIQIAVI